MFDNGDNQYFEPQCCDLCYIPRVWEIFGNKWKILEFVWKVLEIMQNYEL